MAGRTPSVARRLLGAVASAVALLAVQAALAGPAGLVVRAHSQLLSSTPGSGSVVATPPDRLVLVFSEPIDPAHTSLDLLDSSGRLLGTGLGSVAPGSPTVLTATPPTLGGGSYTINWRALSASDGHSTSGSLSFGVGAVAAGSLPLDVGGTGGDLHAGHDAGQILVEVQGRTVADTGFMLAFGLLVVGLGVLAPAGLLRRGLVTAQLVALATGGISAIVLGLAAGSVPGLDPIGFLFSSQSGALLLARAATALAGIVVAVVVLRAVGVRAAAIVGGLAGAIGIALIALGGHAAASGSVGPVADIAVHVGAAGVWIAGVVALAWVAGRSAGPSGGRSRARDLRAAVPRFSAVALVSVALVVGTGVYSAWLQTGDLTTVDSQYAVALIAKVLLVGVALVVGALNLLGRGRGDRRLGGFERRIAIEVVTLAAVLVATANLASGSPPGSERPVELEAVPPVELAGVASAGPRTGADATRPGLALKPGRPGPNAWWSTLEGGPNVDAVELRLERLDQSGSENVVPLRAVPGQSATWVATGGVLPANSRWDATVVATRAGAEVGRTEYRFAIGASGITDGRAALPIDPALVLAAALAVAALLGLAFALAGGTLPGVDRVAGRQALIGGGVVGATLAIVLVVGTYAR
ncbi:MAG TPA: copper resistance protein CopC [Candidatus Limnocylindrales bacterium]|nr:copper resistance protein CopC [Candidatus Limnocylindrales bacterium]